MFKENLVSVITPSYNSEKYIAEAIKSVLAQSYKNWEMIIIDDCSSDNTDKIVKEFQKIDNRIIYFKLKENSGAAIARNKAIEYAKGEFIAFLDSDDLWKSEKLEIQVKLMKEGKYILSFSEYEKIDENGDKLNIKIKVPSKKIGYYNYLLTTPIGCLTAMYSVKEAKGKLFFPLVEKREDTALWLKILKGKGKAYPIKKSLAFYRIHENSVSFNKRKLLKYHWNLYFNVEKLGYIKSIFFIMLNIFVKIFRIKEEKIDGRK